MRMKSMNILLLSKICVYLPNNSFRINCLVALYIQRNEFNVAGEFQIFEKFSKRRMKISDVFPEVKLISNLLPVFTELSKLDLFGLFINTFLSLCRLPCSTNCTSRHIVALIMTDKNNIPAVPQYFVRF